MLTGSGTKLVDQQFIRQTFFYFQSLLPICCTTLDCLWTTCSLKAYPGIAFWQSWEINRSATWKQERRRPFNRLIFFCMGRFNCGLYATEFSWEHGWDPDTGSNSYGIDDREHALKDVSFLNNFFGTQRSPLRGRKTLYKNKKSCTNRTKNQWEKWFAIAWPLQRVCLRVLVGTRCCYVFVGNLYGQSWATWLQCRLHPHEICRMTH